MADSCKSFKTGEGTPHPWFFVSVASKGFSAAVSLVFATLAEKSISVAAKEVRGVNCRRKSNSEKCEEFVAVGRIARRPGTVRKAPSFPTGLESVIPTGSGSTITKVGRAGGGKVPT